MITITIQDFERQLPFAQTATTDLFDSVATGFEASLEALQLAILGSVEPDHSPTIQGHVRAMVILSTFLEKIHSRDIVLTDTGFGVVSNQNVAPASRQRVDALKDELQWQHDKAREELVKQLCTVDGWADSIQAQTQIDTLFWAPSFLMFYTGRGKARNTYDDLAAARKEILAADAWLRRMLGDELIEELLSETRRNDYAIDHSVAVSKIRIFIGKMIDAGDKPELYYTQVADYIESRIDSFPTYRNSKAYAANHAPTYENEKDDPTFFF